MPLLLFIGLSGFIGALARYYLSISLNNYSLFPWGTLAVNLLGSFFLAFFLTLVLVWLDHSSSIVIAISVGFTGSFTTFSALGVETVKLAAVDPLLGVVYVVVSFLGGLFLVFLGKYWGQKFASFIAGNKSPEEAER